MNPQDLTGQRVERYQVQQKLGQGGMAVVYLATDTDLGRQVVLKVMLPHLSRNPEFINRFQREARAIAQLDHPNIIKVYNTGLTPNGDPYFAMQYVAGGTLTDKLKQLAWEQRRFSDSEALHIVRQLAGALATAHQAGIVHRDIKPSNILLQPDNTPILTDLGIAAMQSATKLTRTGVSMGTPHYMSPEQAAGKPVDGRSDLYSLGVVLYELLAGSVPFNADSSMAILHKHIYDPHPPLKNIHPGLKSATYQLVDRCLAKKPEERFQSAAQLVQALDEAATAEQSATSPLSGRPVWLYAIVATAVFLFALLAYFTFFSNNDTPTAIATATHAAAQPVVVIVATDPPAQATNPPTSQPTNQPLTEATSTPAPTATVTPLPTNTPTATPVPVAIGRIVFDSIQSNPSEIFIMNADGTNRTRLTNNNYQDDEADLSASGRFIAYESRPSSDWVINIMDTSGGNVRTLVPGRLPDWSPDDQFIAYETAGGSQTINLYELTTGQTRVLTDRNVLSRSATWSPTGEEIAYMSQRAGVWQIFALNIDTGAERQLTFGDEDKRFPAWSPDGRLIAYNTVIDGNPDDIWLVPTDGSGEAVQVTQEGLNGRPAWSPSSQHLVFNSNNDGPWVLYRIRIDGTEREQLTFGGSDQRADWGN